MPGQIDKFVVLELMGELVEKGIDPPYTPGQIGLKLPDDGAILGSMIKDNLIYMRKGRRGRPPLIYPGEETMAVDSWTPPEKFYPHEIDWLTLDSLRPQAIVERNGRFYDLHGQSSYGSLRDLKEARGVEAREWKRQSTKMAKKWHEDRDGEAPVDLGKPQSSSYRPTVLYRDIAARTIEVRPGVKIGEFERMVSRTRDLASKDQARSGLTRELLYGCSPYKRTITVPAVCLQSALEVVGTENVRDIRTGYLRERFLIDKAKERDLRGQ